MNAQPISCVSTLAELAAFVAGQAPDIVCSMSQQTTPPERIGRKMQSRWFS